MYGNLMLKINLDTITNIVVISTWTFIGLFVLINLLLGFKRGSKKSIYYAVTSLITFVLVAVFISFVTIKWFFPTIDSLVVFLEKIGVSPSSEIIEQLKDPSINSAVYAVFDLIFKGLAFLIIYPFIKLILKLVIYKPIYKRHIAKKENQVDILLKQYTKKSKKDEVSSVSRFGGSIVGIVRGFLTAYIFLIPLILLLGTTSGIKYEFNDTNGFNNFKDISSDFRNNDIFTMLQDINNKTIVGISKGIKIGEKSVDEALYDAVFGSEITYSNGKKAKLELSSETRKMGDLLNHVLEMGLLEKGFDYKSLNYEDDYESIDKILKTLGNFQTIEVFSPLVIEYGLNNTAFFKTFDFHNNENLKSTYDHLLEIKLADDLNVISKIIGEALQVGDVGELLVILKNPQLITDLEPEKQESFIKIFNALGQFNFLKGFNVGLEYLIIKEKLPKINLDEDYEEYYRKQFKVFYDNPALLYSDEGDINKLGLLLKTILIEQELKYDDLKDENNKFNFLRIFDEDNKETVETILTGLFQLDLLNTSLNIGFDYLLYNQLFKNDTDLVILIEEILEQTTLEEELNKIVEILRVLKLKKLNADFVNEITVGNLEEVIEIDSMIFKTLLSSQLKNTGLFPDESFEVTNKKLITKDEMANVLEVLKIFAADDDTKITSIDFNNIEISVDNLKLLVNVGDEQTGSPFVNNLLTKTLTGSGINIPVDAFINNDTEKFIKKTELNNLIDSLEALGINSLKDINIDPKTILVTDLINVISTDSVIINDLISENIINSTIEIPDSAYDTVVVDRLSTSEMTKMLESLVELGITNIDSLDAITPATLDLSNLHSSIMKDSFIIRRMVSKTIIAQSKENGGLFIIAPTSYDNAEKVDITLNELDLLLSNGLDTGFNNIAEILDVIDIDFANIHHPDMAAKIAKISATYIILKNKPADECSQILIDTFADIIENN